MIVVSGVITADNTDVLASTDLANIPELGQIDIFVASTQNDTEITITGPGNEPIIRGQRLQLRSNGMPSLKDDVPLSFVTIQGSHYVVNINIVTAATVNYVAVYRRVDEL